MKRFVSLSAFLVSMVFSLHVSSQDQCNTTRQCKIEYGNQATDCKNSRSSNSVCMCGSEVCKANTISLEDQAAALPEGTVAQKIKKVVLELALTRANNARSVSLNTEAQTLEDDVENGLVKPAEEFAQRNRSGGYVPVLRLLLTETNNPYLDAMVQEANDDLSLADGLWSRATAGNPVFSGLNGDYGVRSSAELIREYFWLFAHEQSPMKNDTELLRRFLRRAHAFVDAMNLDPEGSVESVALWDQFAVESLYSGLYEIITLYPDLLLPSEQLAWDNAIRVTKAAHMDWSRLIPGYVPVTYNKESARMVAYLYMGLYTNDQALVDRVIEHSEQVIAAMRIDGGVPYSYNGNPSVNYHNVLMQSLAHIYDQTGHEPIATGLRASQWKGMVMGRTDEFWTSPHFKSVRWNITKGTEAGPEAVMTLTGNAYLRGMLDRNMALGSGSGILHGRDQVAWYTADVEPKSLPDNYTIPDRNVRGPRAWYGNWSYAGAFAPGANDEVGRETLMGSMTVDNDGRVNSILVDVTGRVWMEPFDGSKTSYYHPSSDGGTTSAWGYLTDNETTKAATTISKNFSVNSSLHKITAAKGPTKGAIADWFGRQLWVGLPGRMVGLVSVVPSKNNAEAYAINGVLRLISGGAAGAAVTKEMKKISNTHYQYGQLDIIVHHSTYGDLTFYEKEYRRVKYPATELVFNNGITEKTGIGSKKSFSKNTNYQFVVEVRPRWSEPLESVAVLGGNVLIGLEVVTQERAIQAWLNASTADKELTLRRGRLPSGKDSYAVSSGVLKNVIFKNSLPSSPINLNSGQHAVLVVSEHDWDHGNGWESFERFVLGD